jgi:undecaprenol kinase
MHKHHISFKHAIDGLITALITQPNFRIHLILSLIAIILGILTGISGPEWAIITFTIACGLSVELLNTAIEFTVDLLTDQHHLLAKYAKDTAAGAMLIYALGSIVVGAFIFLPKLWPSI